MNLKQAARRLGIHYQTAYKLVRSGRLAAVRVGGSYEISDAAIERYLAEREAMYRVPVPPADLAPGRDDARGDHSDDVADLVARAQAATDATLTSARPALEIIAEGLAHCVGDLAIVRPVSEDRQWLLPGVVHHRDVRIRCIVAAAAERFPQALPSRAIGDGTVGETVFVPHVPQDRLRADMPAELTQHLDVTGVHSLVSMPAVAGREVFGVVTVTRDAPGNPYTTEDVATVALVAAVAGQALARARAAGEVFLRRRSLTHALGEAFAGGDGWAAATELVRDGEVGELICDTAGRVIAANKSAAQLTGRDPADLTGRSFTDLLAAEEVEDERAAIDRLLRGELTYLDGCRALRDGDTSNPARIHLARAVVRDAAMEPRALAILAFDPSRPAALGTAHATDRDRWSERAGRRRAS